MRLYSTDFHSLMAEAGILSTTSFDGYIKKVLGFGETQDLNLDGFIFEPASQLEFDYAQIQLENQISVMATYPDKDSEVIPFGSKGFETSRGVIPRQKARFLMDEDDYRKYLVMVNNLNIQGGNVKEYALDLLFSGLGTITKAHELSMTYQRDQMVSNRSLTLSAANNPRGLKSISFSANVPDANVTTLALTKRWFTDADKATEGAACTPVEDVRNIVRTLKRAGYIDLTIEVDEVSFYEDMQHTQWKKAIGYRMRPDLLGSPSNDTNATAVAAGATDLEILDAFKKVIGVNNVILRTGLAGVEALNSTTKKLDRTKVRTFVANTYVFYPTGGLGTIKTVAPLLPDEKAMYGKILSGRGIIQYEYDVKSKTQDWWSELTALCVPNRVSEMYYLITK